ncbi:kelch-like protein 10 [Tachypleus tridentatus]|uniref:kelch-like protein 10 n=1 Tax=Tachypleus tridentatus TaxID=6853 RepID=UPI003FD1ED72
MSGSGDVFQDMSSVLDELRVRRQLCDGVIRTPDGGEFWIHRAIVSTAGPFFRALFTNSLSGEEIKDVMIPNITAEIMSLILEYAYTRNVSVTSNNVEKLLPAADQFQVAGIVRECCRFLSCHLRVDNCVGIYKIAKHYYCPSLENSARNFLLYNFLLVSNRSPEFPFLGVEDLEAILNTDELNIEGEDQAFISVIHWVDHDPENRKRHLPTLLGAIRFGLCNYRYFVDHVLKHPYVTDSYECQAALFEASVLLVEMETNESNRPVLEFQHPLLRPRVPYEILFVIGGWSSGSATSLMETYDCRANRWFLSTHSDTMPRAYHGLAALDRYIYMVGGFDGNQCFNSMRCYDCTSHEWSERACMYVARCYISIAVLNGLIYAIGGYDGRVRTNTGESYDPQRNQWTLIANMNRQRSDASAAALNGKIYVAGGFNGHEVLNSAEMYDPLTNSWTFIRNMSSPRSGVSLTVYNNAVYVLGGFNGMARLATVAKYDVTRNHWTDLPDMLTPRSNFTTGIVDNILFVIGGFNGNTTVPYVESYDTTTNEWKEVTSMNLNRSALCACVLKGLPNAREYTFLGNTP